MPRGGVFDVSFLILSSLAVVFANAASGSLAYARLRRIDYKSGLLFAAATIPGAVAGALVNFAALLHGKIPVNLNYTLSSDGVAEPRRMGMLSS